MESCSPVIEKTVKPSGMSARALHYVFKIGNRKASYDFFTSVLKMKILRHEEFTEGCKATCNGPYNGRWSKTMVGYGSEDDNFVIELTYNYQIGSYVLGNDYFGIYIENAEAFEHIKKMGGYEVRPCGKLMVRDPDGHMFMVDNVAGSPKIVRTAVNVVSIQKSIDYWRDIIGMTIISQNEKKKTVTFSFGQEQCRWELRELDNKLDRGTGFGRIAFSYTDDKLADFQAKVKASNLPVLKELVTLETPGKADVEVIILEDPDKHEICFVGDKGFRQLSVLDDHAEAAMRKAIQEDDSDNWFKDGKPRG